MIYKKITEAIDLIKKSPLKKTGRNTYSEYDYYTPEQINKLVYDACKQVGLYCRFDLIRNEFGIQGEVVVWDTTDFKEAVTFTMASDVPSIKATNIAQQLGGAMTYTKRYMLMNIFDIVDNNLDFDTTSNTKKQNEPVKETKPAAPKDQIEKAKQAIESGNITRDQAIEKLKAKFNLTEENIKAL